jgi:hypothetical protein
MVEGEIVVYGTITIRYFDKGFMRPMVRTVPEAHQICYDALKEAARL